MEVDDDSSIDGSLQGFMMENGIDLDLKKRTLDNELSYHELPDENFEGSHGEYAFDLNSIDVLLPYCVRVNKILSDQGYTPIQLTLSDINQETRTISAFVVDSWAESICSPVIEMSERVDFQQRAVQNASMTVRKGDINLEALQSRISDLQVKLMESEKREKLLFGKKEELEEQLTSRSKVARVEDMESKKMLKQFEYQVQEYERKLRQKEVEINKLKEKLVAVVNKERASEHGHRIALQALRQGEVDSTNASLCSSTSATTSSFSSPVKRAGSHSVASTHSLPEVLRALQVSNDQLSSENKEFQSQISELNMVIKDLYNSKQYSKSETGHSDHPSSRRSKQQHQQRDRAESDDETESEAQAVKDMYHKLTEQKRRIDQLEHRNEQQQRVQQDSEDSLLQMRSRASELRDEIENLRLELDSRPTVKQWNQQKRETQDLEDKLHDLIMMRGEAAEVAAWRKHLSTSDRIKVDKRNHELGLWLLDSLPKAVTKEVLQAVCRELDVSDVSEVQPSIVKLKAVVAAVPRMERFISTVCAYLFQRDPNILQLGGRGLQGRPRPSMDDVLPVLKSWWNTLQKCDSLNIFRSEVLQQLHRREVLLTSKQAKMNRRGEEDHSEGEDSDPDNAVEAWNEISQQRWERKDIHKILEILQDMTDFQVEVFMHQKSFSNAQDFIRDKPEAMVSRLLSHVQYLFDVPSLDGLLPRMNQVYLFAEEMKNFMKAVKSVLCGTSASVAAMSDAIVISEVLRRLTSTTNQ